MSLFSKIRYKIYSIFNLDATFRKEEFLKRGGQWGKIVRFFQMLNLEVNHI